MTICSFCNLETEQGRALFGCQDFVCESCSAAGEKWAIRMARKDKDGYPMGCVPVGIRDGLAKDLGTAELELAELKEDLASMIISRDQWMRIAKTKVGEIQAADERIGVLNKQLRETMQEREELYCEKRKDAEVIRGLKEALEAANQKSRNLLEEIRILQNQLEKHGIGYFSLHPAFPHRDVLPPQPSNSGQY